MSLWDWTLDVYARPGVSDACLALQDGHGQNVPFLLWAVWAEGADETRLSAAAEVARNWDAGVVQPLREIRRRLKPSFPMVQDGARESLRDDVKAAELRAERVLMEAFEGLGGGRGGKLSLAALQAASAAWGSPAPDEALSRLAQALG